MSPRELVEEAFQRMTDGSLTFRLQEDAYTIAAVFVLDGCRHTHVWSKALLSDDPKAADQGVCDMLHRANEPPE